MVKSVRILDIGRQAGLANRQVQLIIAGEVLQEIPGPFEAELRNAVQQQIGFKGSTYTMTIFDIRARPTGMNPIRGVNSEQ